MGFFSWECEVCGRPLLCEAATEDKNKWMTQCVFIENSYWGMSTVSVGEYDGYGRLETEDGDEVEFSAPTCYHKKCWELAGRDTEYEGESKPARDQGWFFEENHHNLPEPQTLEEAKEYYESR